MATGGLVLGDDATMITCPRFHVGALPDLAHLEFDHWLRPVFAANELLYALAGDAAEHVAYFGRAYIVMHREKHSHYATCLLTTCHVPSTVIVMRNTTATPADEHRCLRCGRSLRVSQGYGPRCAAKIRKAAVDAARAGFTADQQAKADELIRDGGLAPVRMTARNGMLFRAVSSRGDETYLCCANGCACKSRRGCYHMLSAKVVGITTRRSSLAKAA